MSDENDDAVGSVQVKVSPKAVHMAVRNILKNELGVTKESIAAQIDALVKAHSDEQIRMRVVEHINNAGLGRDTLTARVNAAFTRRIDDILPIVRDVARELVGKEIREQVEGAVAATVAAGMEVSIGWKHKVPVGLKEADHSRHDWIAVDERLPRPGQMVLVYHGNIWNDGRAVDSATHSHEGVFLAPGDPQPLVKVTHWRSYPSPPPPEGR